MPPRPTGSIEPYTWDDGETVSYRVRVRAYGRQHRLTLGTNREGWNEERARAELDGIIERVERGTWEPPARRTEADDVAESETVQVTASRWWQRKSATLSENARADYRWRLDYVLAYLGREQTGSLDVRRVDGFRDRLVSKDLSPRSVNMILGLLAQVLDDAARYELLDVNPARAQGTRLRSKKGSRSFLTPDQVVDLLDEAGAWEAELPPHQRNGRRALLALLCLAGPRVGEAIASDRGEFDLAAGRWHIPKAKTPAGERDVELTLFLADELRGHAAGLSGNGRAPMFPTRTGGRQDRGGIGSRVAEVVERVNERRAEDGRQLLPRLTPHSLRRTFASLALAAGRDPRWVMAQLGHEDARFTLSVYAQVIQRQSLDRALLWRLMRLPGEADFEASETRSETFAPDRPSGAAGKMPGVAWNPHQQ